MHLTLNWGRGGELFFKEKIKHFSFLEKSQLFFSGILGSSQVKSCSVKRVINCILSVLSGLFMEQSFFSNLFQF